MSHLLFQDGQFFRDDKLVAGASCRGLRYGDGLFETMKVNREAIQLAPYHMDRLLAGMDLLQFDRPSYVNKDYFLEKILQLVHRNGHGKLARVRLMVYRGNGGLYDPESHYPHHIIQSWSLPEANHHWNQNGLVVGVHEMARKSMDLLANCKTNNYLPYVMGALEAKKHKWNDALILNGAHRIADATIANLFLVKRGEVLTPSLEEGCVAGVMRRYLLEQLRAAGMECRETQVTLEMAEQADEMFLTNSTYGMRWVGRLGSKTYGQEYTYQLYQRFILPLFSR